MTEQPRRHALSRRDLLLGGGGVALGLTAAVGAHDLLAPPETSSPDLSQGAASPVPVAVLGAHQAGIDRPETPQHSGMIAVCDAEGVERSEDVLDMLSLLGRRIDDLTASEGTRLLPDGPGDLTVTVGIGPRLATLVDASLPGSVPLPEFAGDGELPEELNGGDIFLAVHSSDASASAPVADALAAAVPGGRVRWRQAGFRGPGEGTIARNPLGYHDGVIVPRTPDELAANVWIADGPAAGGTVAVVRRLRLDVRRFRALDDVEQDRTVGRTMADGAPLSGGRLEDEADLTAKTSDGRYTVPLRSHVRAAHPSFTGSALMLRRGYAYSNAAPPGAEPDDGLLFICFQRDLDTFVRTQHRLDEADDLMGYATTTASASFLIPPGRRAGEELGERLRGG